MTPKQVLKDITKSNNMTQAEMAQWLGYSSQQVLSAKINRANNMNVGEMLKLLNALGYKVKVEKWGGNKYELTTEETEIPKVEVAPVRELNAEETKADMMKRLEELNR